MVHLRGGLCDSVHDSMLRNVHLWAIFEVYPQNFNGEEVRVHGISVVLGFGVHIEIF